MTPAQLNQLVAVARQALALLDPDWQAAKALKLALIACQTPTTATPVDLEPSMLLCVCGHEADAHQIGPDDELLRCAMCECDHFKPRVPERQSTRGRDEVRHRRSNQGPLTPFSPRYGER